MADQMIVMKGGKAVETGPSEQIFLQPQNAYTRALIQAAFRTRTLDDEGLDAAEQLPT